MANPIVELNIKELGTITVQLSPDHAPATVNNFLYLVDSGFYNGLTFHRVIKGFMIQGGCPIGNGTGSAGWSIKGEFKANGVDNALKHKRGTISMARAQNPNSAGSQFFIMHDDAPHLDGLYAAFGKVISGIEVVDKVADVKTNAYDKPTKDVVIESARIIDLDGVEITKP